MSEINKTYNIQRFGTNDNYTEIREDGTQRLKGDATAWKDIIMDIFSKRLNNTTGKVDYDWDNNVIKFQSGGDITNKIDRVQGNQEINHELLIGDNIIFKPHVHWFQEVISHNPDVLDDTEYELTLKWRLIRNSYGTNLTTPEWNTITLTANSTNNIFDTTNLNGEEYLNQITRFPDITVNCGVSDTLQFQIARTDTLDGNMLVYFFDLHAQVSAFGSDTEFIKTE